MPRTRACRRMDEVVSFHIPRSEAAAVDRDPSSRHRSRKCDQIHMQIAMRFFVHAFGL
jgi:hypothetical protein